ncbi:MAG: hypothetical protein DME55_14290 [Verrucomicrobia bacterium]|nr:MAG: hypothetical protein DME55_14290 [Verrucomicrobiota bacterium]
MDEKNTRLAEGNNFLIERRRGRCSAPVRNRGPKAYLAINWQQGNINSQFTWQDQRFPTPHPQPRNNQEIRALLTTRQLLLLNPPGKTVALLPIWLRNSGVLAPRYGQKAERGAGGSAARSQKDASIHKLTRNFCAIGRTS